VALQFSSDEPGLPVVRTAGYRRALAEAGIAFEPAWQVEGSNSFAGGDAGVRALLRQPGRRSAAAFGFDGIALGRSPTRS
jgi:DNA-binding LacI/PurR family transcriptional regulator